MKFCLHRLLLIPFVSVLSIEVAVGYPLSSRPDLECRVEEGSPATLIRSATSEEIDIAKLKKQTRRKLNVVKAFGNKRKVEKLKSLLEELKSCAKGHSSSPSPDPSLTPTPTSSPTPQIPTFPTPTPTATPSISPTPTPPPANLIRVGPSRQYQTLSQALAAATDGQLIEIDAGEYVGVAATAVINKNAITIRGVGGRPIFNAQGSHAEGKGTWVIKGTDTVVENIEFRNAAVPDQNGAGIRFEGHNLTVLGSAFFNNQNGILTAAINTGNIIIAFSEFGGNGFGTGQTHNIYVNYADAFVFMHNNSHHANVGHLVKSRANNNLILYNRLMDEDNGTASYEIDLPNGGFSYVMGNVIQQGPATQNSIIISYGAEGISNAGSDLYVVNNTIVNDRTQGGTFIRSLGGQVTAQNNLFVGNGTILVGAGNLSSNLQTNSPGFVDRAGYNYRLTETSPARDQGTIPGIVNSINLRPVYQYLHNSNGEARPVNGNIDIGAYEFVP